MDSTHLIKKMASLNLFSIGDYFKAFQELKKCTHPRYSIRGMAKYFNLSPSMMVLIVQGKRCISKKSLNEICKKLELDETYSKILFLMNEYQGADSTGKKNKIVKKIKILQATSLEHRFDSHKFSIISSWFYLAVLDAIKTNPLGRTSQEIAQILKMNNAKVKSVLGVLIQEGYVLKVKYHYQAIHGQVLFQNELVSKDFQRYFLELSQLSAKYLSKSIPDTEYIGAVSIPFSRAKLDLAKEACDEFFLKIRSLTTEGENHDHVYTCFLHFFPLANC